MGSYCIINDNSCQLTSKNPNNLLFTLAYTFSEKASNSGNQDKTPKILLPKLLKLDQSSLINPPKQSRIVEVVTDAVHKYDDVFVIFHSRELTHASQLVYKSVAKITGRGTIHLVDSLSLSAGQGYLIQMAMNLCEQGNSGKMVEELLREKIPHIYSLLCTQNISYIHNAGFLDQAQTVISEILGFYSIFGMEEGLLNPLEKTKNLHSVIEYFLEYIEEFDSIDQVIFIHPDGAPISESKLIRDFIDANYENTAFLEMPANDFFSSLTGPKGFGLFLIEK